MPTTPEASRRRWKKVPLAERRRLMAKLTQGRIAAAEKRKLAEAIERVKAAGYQLEAAS